MSQQNRKTMLYIVKHLIESDSVRFKSTLLSNFLFENEVEPTKELEEGVWLFHDDRFKLNFIHFSPTDTFYFEKGVSNSEIQDFIRRLTMKVEDETSKKEFGSFSQFIN